MNQGACFVHKMLKKRTKFHPHPIDLKSDTAKSVPLPLPQFLASYAARSSQLFIVAASTNPACWK